MKQREKILIITEIGILVGIALVLDVIFGLLSIATFPWGGSVSLAMLPIFIIAYRRGVKSGLIAGLIFAILQMLVSGMFTSSVIAAIPDSTFLGPKWMNLIMVYLLDYLIPFTLLGLAGLFKNALTNLKPFILGMVFASFLRYISHGLSGVIIWSGYTEWFNEEFNMNVSPFVYSFVAYNLPYMLASLVFCILVGIVLFKRGLLTINLKENE